MSALNQVCEKQTVLVVDDMIENIMVLDSILQDDYIVRVATTGEKALHLAALQRPPDIILLDVLMPIMDGFEVCRRLKANPLTSKIPIIFVTTRGVEDEAQGLQLGAVDYITKPINPAIVRARIQTHLALYDQNRALELKVQARTQALEFAQNEVIYSMEQLQLAQAEMLERLAQAAELRDDTTGQHIQRVGRLSALLAEELGLSSFQSDMIRRAAPLHDVGKIGIADHILLKPGRLTDTEYAIMRTHTTIGANILGNGSSELMRIAEHIAISHHERWDGSGYPFQLQGHEIPIEGQIVSIVDVFDALTHARPYKRAWSVDAALSEIIRDSGKMFNPEIVRAFLSLPHSKLT